MQLDLVKNVSKASVFRNSASVGGSEFGDLPILEKTISITTMHATTGCNKLTAMTSTSSKWSKQWVAKTL